MICVKKCFYPSLLLLPLHQPTMYATIQHIVFGFVSVIHWYIITQIIISMANY